MEEIYSEGVFALNYYEIHKNKAKYIVFAIICLAVSAASFLFLLYAGRYSDWGPALLAGALALILLMTTLALFRRIRGSSVVIRLEPAYLEFLDIPNHPLRFPWNEVKGFEVYTVQGQPLLGFVLEDEEKYLEGLPAVTKTLLKANQKLGCPAFNIGLRNIKKPDEALEALAKIYENAG